MWQSGQRRQRGLTGRRDANPTTQLQLAQRQQRHSTVREQKRRCLLVEQPAVRVAGEVQMSRLCGVLLEESRRGISSERNEALLEKRLPHIFSLRPRPEEVTKWIGDSYEIRGTRRLRPAAL